MNGKVTLVGAGCGKGLITLKGLETLKSADAVVYDDLIDSELLDCVKSDCELIYVGKRSGKHSESQQTINNILIEKATENKNVVRLKGGDSFVFGRGGEEISALTEKNIHCEVVPGVTAAVAVLEQFGIPVTHRSVAQSFSVITGHTATQMQEDYSALAKLNGTLVFMMGLGNAGYIAKRLMENGKNRETPCAILSKGFQADGKRINCTLETLEQFAKTAETPAVIVVGKTAEYDFSGVSGGELSGVSVSVTGTKQFVNKLADRLEQDGAAVNRYAYLRIEPNKDLVPISFKNYTWLVFTSANGIDVMFSQLKDKKVDYRSLMHLKFACIGKGSAEKLKQYGFYADFVPNEYTARALGEQLGKIVSADDKALILRAENGSPELTRQLEIAGVRHDEIHIYKAVGNSKKLVCESDFIVFASGSSVEAFFKNSSELGGAMPVCIGKITAERLKKYVNCSFLTAEEHTADGIIKVIKENRK